LHASSDRHPTALLGAEQTMAPAHALPFKQSTSHRPVALHAIASTQLPAPPHAISHSSPAHSMRPHAPAPPH
jgi:hypothetical protein